MKFGRYSLKKLSLSTIVILLSGFFLVLFTNAAEAPTTLANFIRAFENSPQGARVATPDNLGNIRNSIPIVLEYLQANPAEQAKVSGINSSIMADLRGVGLTVEPMDNMGLTITGGNNQIGRIVSEISRQAPATFIVSPYTFLTFSQTRAVAVTYIAQINLLYPSLPMLRAADINVLAPMFLHEGLHAGYNANTNSFNIKNAVDVSDFADLNLNVHPDITAADGYAGKFSSSESIAYLYEAKAQMLLGVQPESSTLLRANSFANLACIFAHRLASAPASEIQLWSDRERYVFASLTGKDSQLLVGKRNDFPNLTFTSGTPIQMPAQLHDRVRTLAENAYAAYNSIRAQTLSSEFSGVAGYLTAAQAQDRSFGTKAFSSNRPAPTVRAIAESEPLLERAQDMLEIIESARTAPVQAPAAISPSPASSNTSESEDENPEEAVEQSNNEE